MPLHHWRKNHESAASKDLKHIDLLDERSSSNERRIFFSPIVRIERMTTGKMVSKDKPKGEQRNFAHFAGKAKPLGLNVTNCETLEDLSGSPDPKDWVGMTIQLYVDPQCKYPAGKKGPGIRIRPKLPNAPADTSPLPTVSDEARAQLEEEHQERLEEREPGQD
jgi:hypothetical protein